MPLDGREIAELDQACAWQAQGGGRTPARFPVRPVWTTMSLRSLGRVGKLVHGRQTVARHASGGGQREAGIRPRRNAAGFGAREVRAINSEARACISAIGTKVCEGGDHRGDDRFRQHASRRADLHGMRH